MAIGQVDLNDIIEFVSDWFEQDDVDTGFGEQEKEWLWELNRHYARIGANGGTTAMRYRFIELFNRLHIHMCSHHMVNRPQTWYMTDYAQRFLILDVKDDGTQDTDPYGELG